MPAAPSTSRRAAPLPPDERRAAIIEAVLPVLIEVGEAATTKQLAQAAGVSEGTIFKVFADKHELLTAALQTAIDPTRFEAAIAAIDPDLDFEAQLISATEYIQHRIVDIWRLISSVGRNIDYVSGPLPDSPQLAALFATRADRLAIDPTEAARVLRALTLTLTHPMLAPEPFSAARIVEVLLHGIGVPR